MILCPHILRQLPFIQIQESIKILLTLSITKIQYKGQWYDVKHINFLRITVLRQVPEQHLFVGQFLMKLKMIETVFEYFVIYAILVLIGFIGLLPTKVQK